MGYVSTESAAMPGIAITNNVNNVIGAHTNCICAPVRVKLATLNPKCNKSFKKK